MKITSKLMKVNQSLELPQRGSQSLPTKNGKLCCFQVCILSNGANCLECLQRLQFETMVGRVDPTDWPFVQGRGLLCSLLTGQDLELGQAPRNSVLQTSIARWLLVLLYAAISCRALYQSTNMGMESKDRGGKKLLLPRPYLHSQC